MKSIKPFRPYMLTCLFLFFSFMGWARMQQSIFDWNELIQWGIRPNPLYLALTGGLWGILGLGSTCLLWMRRRWALNQTFVFGLVFALTYWADRLLFTRSSASTANLCFAALLTLIACVYLFAVISLMKNELPVNSSRPVQVSQPVPDSLQEKPNEDK